MCMQIRKCYYLFQFITSNSQQNKRFFCKDYIDDFVKIPFHSKFKSMKKIDAYCFEYGRNHETVTNILTTKQTLKPIISIIKG
jgi:hypothetical protein